MRVPWVMNVGDVLKEGCARIGKDGSKGEIQGVRTGLGDLDQLVGGFREGSVSVLAARPSMGKTALAVGIALHAALCQKVKCLYVSLDRQPDGIANLMLVNLCGLDSHRLRMGRLTPKEYERLSRGVELLGESPLYTTTIGAVSVDDVELAVFMEHEHGQAGMKDGPRLVVIDALEDLILDTEERDPSEELDASERRELIMQSLAKTAREYKTALLVLTQLSRSVDKRLDHKPRLRDLPYLRQTEPYANAILFLMRPAYYADPEDGAAEITVARSRFGMTGVHQIHFDRNCVRFAASGDNGKPVCPYALDDNSSDGPQMAK